MTFTPRLLMLKGLPASGKSTYAKKLVNEQGYKRVNKDDLRLMLDNGKWTRGNEKLVFGTEVELVQNMLRAGHNVVIDDTNFAHEVTWCVLADNCGAEFEVKFFDTPLIECIERDSKRGDKAVGSKVIYSMYDRYLKPKKIPFNQNLPCTYIFDIDGTLAHMDGRSPYDYSKVHTDKPDQDVAILFRTLKDIALAGNKIICCSGRDSDCRDITLQWLKDNNLEPDLLLMRPEGDKRKDSIIKEELYNEHIKGKYNVLGVFDDRDQVVETWRSLGLTCFQVGYGFF